jgi:phosphoribosyl 1,2-cyclic phosphate phosphodiesterase
MTIKFLGTSAGWPLPRLGCTCEICSSKDPKDRRLRPSLLINDFLLVDAGPDVYHQLIKNAPQKIKAILVTHAHPDHILGFHDLSHIYNRSPRPKDRGSLFLAQAQNKEGKLKVLAPQEVINGIKKHFEFPMMNFVFIPTQPAEPFELDHLKITYFEVEHTKRPCFGLKIKGEKLVSYIPDFRKISQSSQAICRSSDILILDGSSLGSKGQVFSHVSVIDAISLAKTLKPKMVYFSHLGHITGKHRELEDFVQSRGGSKFHIAYDGLELNL